MIVATLATYPPRENYLTDVVHSIAPQVDRFNIVLNEFDHVPDACALATNINVIRPEQDTKDTGKFLPGVEPDDWLFTVDDDLFYPPDYVKESIRKLEAAGGPGLIGGYHGSIYKRHPYLRSRFMRRLLGRNPNYIVGSRDIYGFSREVRNAFYVDQLGTGVALMRGCDAPPFEAVAHGQKYIDVAAARYWYENGKSLVCLPRKEDWITERGYNEESIIASFTSHTPKHVADEIYAFAFKNKKVFRLSR